MSKFKLKNGIFSRLVLIFLIIMIPVYILGIYIYNWGVQTIKQEISKSTIAQASFYIGGLEKEIERIRILQYDCLNDENLNKLAIRWDILDKYSRSECMRQLQQRLITVKNSSIYIKDVNAHILPIQRTLSANNVLGQIDMEKFENIRVPYGVRGAQLISYKDGLYLSTLQKSNLSFNNSLYLLEIELDLTQLKSELAQFNTYSNSGSFLVNAQNNSIIIDKSTPENAVLISQILTSINLNDENGIEFVKIRDKGHYVVYIKSEYLNMTLIRYIPEQYILQPLQNFYIWVWIFSVVTIIILIIYSFSAYKYMHKPLLELVESFHKVEMGNMQAFIAHDSKDEFGYLYIRFNDMVRNLNMLIDQVYKQKILMQKAELKQLQSQIDPHFLYNSFFVLNTMARIGDENLIGFTKLLGEYFRFVTRNTSDFVSLSEEINHAKNYLGIQSMRFSKRLQTYFDECPEKYLNVKVPRLILQPIIENAFEHGIEIKKQVGLVKVSFDTSENHLCIIVEDNGSDISDSRLSELQSIVEHTAEEAEITGIINIHRRIRLVYGDGSGLQFSRSDLGGLKVQMRIDLNGGRENE